MSQSRYILVHDLGTTGIKATLFDAAGATVATAFCLISSANGAPIGIPWLWRVCGAHDVARPGRDRGRAVLEGVAFNLKMILDAFLEQGAVIRAMRLIGGGARSALWRQILADVYGLPILRPALLAEATSLGAAIAGGVGVGLFPDFRVAREIVQVEEGERPDPDHNQRYTALYGLFQRTCTALEPIFAQLAALEIRDQRLEVIR